VTATVHEFARRKRPHTEAPSSMGARNAATPVATTHHTPPAAVGGGPNRRPAHNLHSSVSHIAAGRPASHATPGTGTPGVAPTARPAMPSPRNRPAGPTPPNAA